MPERARVGRIRGMIKGAGAFLALGLAISFVQPVQASSSGVTDGRTDPSIARLAHASPKAPVSVIVREQQPSSSAAEDLVRKLGGRITRELPIIRAFAARLSAGSALEL